MGLYADRVLPYLIHTSLRHERFDPYRRRLLSGAHGRVLEIGVGSGLNLPLYAGTTARVIGIDPSGVLLAKARGARWGAEFPVTLVRGAAEQLPLEDDSIDTAVSSWTLCSVADAPRTIEEIRRVLKPTGRLLFVEHGRSPDTGVQRWQDRLTPIWRRFAGGCHLNRPVARLLEDNGFRLERLANGYMTGPRPLTYMYEGVAVPR